MPPAPLADVGAAACGSKGAYNRPSYPCHYCTYWLLRQGAVDKAKAYDQRHAGERQHRHLQVRKAVGGLQRRIAYDTFPPKTSLSLVGATRRKVQVAPAERGRFFIFAARA